MFGLLKLLVFVGALAGFVWWGVTVPLGERTFFAHLRAITESKESQELVRGTKEKVDEVKKRIGGDEAPAREAAKGREDEPGPGSSDGSDEAKPARPAAKPAKAGETKVAAAKPPAPKSPAVTAGKPDPKAPAKPEARAAAKPEPSAAAKPEARAAAKPEARAVAKVEPKKLAVVAPLGATSGDAKQAQARTQKPK